MISRRQMLQAGGAMGVAIALPHIARAAGQRLRLAHAANETHPAHRYATAFAEALEDIMPGGFDVQIFPNRQLGGDKALLEATIAGTLDMSAPSGVLFPLVTGQPAMDAWQLPFLVRDYDHFQSLASTAASQNIEADLAGAGLVGLGTFDGGQRHFLSVDKPIRKLEDFAGLKTRIVPVPLHKAIWEALGTAPTGMPYGEIYGALETGVIDAVEINVSSMIGENLWEVGKHFTLTGHYPWHMVAVASQGYWDGLNEEQQNALREAGKRAVAAAVSYAKQQDAEGKELLKSKGVEISELQDLGAMKDNVASITQEWSAKDALIADFVKKAGSQT